MSLYIQQAVSKKMHTIKTYWRHLVIYGNSLLLEVLIEKRGKVWEGITNQLDNIMIIKIIRELLAKLVLISQPGELTIVVKLNGKVV